MRSVKALRPLPPTPWPMANPAILPRRANHRLPRPAIRARIRASARNHVQAFVQGLGRQSWPKLRTSDASHARLVASMDHGHDMNGGGQSALVQPPADVLSEVIPPRVREDWQANPTEELLQRLGFLCASGPRPSDRLAAMRMMHSRAVRAAWEAYVYCAYACGFFTGSKAADLCARLASRSPADFRSAMAECMACWFLAGRLRLPVGGDAPGRGAKMLDMRTVIDRQDVGVEVKAPHRERPPEGQAWCGHDGDLIEKSLDTANKQFADDVPNILVLAPQLRTPVSTFRVQLVSALYGEEKITCPIDTRTGGPAGPVTTKFFPEGKLLRRRQPNGALIKPTGFPGFTRVSVVVVIEEEMREWHPHPITTLWHEAMADASDGALHDAWAVQEARHYSSDNHCWIDHAILVAHNPHAARPLSPDIFREYVQFMEVSDGYGWSDGERL